MAANPHTPVLLNEVVSHLQLPVDGIYCDLTLGRAGHAAEMFRKVNRGALYGFDQDETALSYSKKVLDKIGPNYTLIHTNFVNAADELKRRGVVEVDGVLLDLGVSSPMFDEPERGFSYRYDGPLDMRMDQYNGRKTAADIVNIYTLGELTKIFREYGEEKYAYQIAKNIVKTREVKPITTTGELVEIIKKSKPARELAKKGHPAKQVFQALRIEVNDELNVLSETLHAMLPLLRSGGRLAVISFHSLEDRIVKNIFKEYAVVIGNRHLPIQEEASYVLVNRKVIIPSEYELKQNPRAASAKLRIIERK